ncbi:uncharacterized protein F5147DRAFT_716898 [Suillus discolor]|uniref:Secreted protein n=1 Tax=Suillus discolor TaxID=1912936 RepID=A0A9P7EYQ6_9AGAM|nr:uncharacterized protein F5147DRAFT_716898 [Suillus discolor]KAG2096068.1 hypothetical protein F5147DRAFT_716898 [Suillus discolor]
MQLVSSIIIYLLLDPCLARSIVNISHSTIAKSGFHFALTQGRNLQYVHPGLLQLPRCQNGLREGMVIGRVLIAKLPVREPLVVQAERIHDTSCTSTARAV